MLAEQGRKPDANIQVLELAVGKAVTGADERLVKQNADYARGRLERRLQARLFSMGAFTRVRSE